MDERDKSQPRDTDPALVDKFLDSDRPEVRWGFFSICLVAAGVLGFIILQVLAPSPVQLQQQVTAQLVRVQTVQLIQGPISVKGNGPVRPRADVILSAQVSGEIIATSPALVTGGSFKKGETLAHIDPRPFRSALNQAQADRQALQADLEFAEKQLQRDQKLTASGAKSERQRDETLNQRDRTKAQIAGLDALISARLIDLERTAIIAPFDGRVLTDLVDEGSVVRPGVEIARVYATDIFEIIVPFSDREAALIPGLWDTERRQTVRATATLPFRGRLYRWDGYVDRVEAGIDPDTRTIDVIVRVAEPTRPGYLIDPDTQGIIGDPPPMLIGTYADIEIDGVSLSYALIPRSGLKNGNSVWLVKNDKTLKVISVEVIQDQESMVAIRSSGLEAGAKIVVSSLDFATDGLEVRIVDQDGEKL
ncbi:MAG: efflux RND transporter periplasmic adaptor subunit [Rhodospirillaceae bacterium]